MTAVQYLANSPDDLTARSITFPSSVKSINRILCYAYGSGSDTVTYGCFHYCSSLTDVEIPNSVTRIRDFAFSECTSLASVILPTSLKTLDGNAFSYCSSLVEVTIPYGQLRQQPHNCAVQRQAHFLPLL